MANRRSNLGRGLGALLGTQAVDMANSKTKDVVQEIPVNAIKPNRYQPRRVFDNDAMKDLSESIKVYGVLQPIMVRKLADDTYEIIAGERRLSASKLVGLEKIPAIIRDYTDAQMSEVAIIENVQRQDLGAIEEATAYERLIKEFGYTQDTLAAKIGRSRSHITNLMRLLRLTPQVREWVSAGKLSMGQARPLLAIDNEELQLNAAEMIIAEDLSVRNVEAFVRELRNSGLISSEPEPVDDEDKPRKVTPQRETPKKTLPKSKVSPYDKHFREAEKNISKMLGTPVKIISDSTTNQIRIDAPNEMDLLRLASRIEKIFRSANVRPINKAEKPNTPTATKEEKISALRKYSTGGAVN